MRMRWSRSITQSFSLILYIPIASISSNQSTTFYSFSSSYLSVHLLLCFHSVFYSSHSFAIVSVFVCVSSRFFFFSSKNILKFFLRCVFGLLLHDLRFRMMLLIRGGRIDEKVRYKKSIVQYHLMLNQIVEKLHQLY